MTGPQLSNSLIYEYLEGWSSSVYFKYIPHHAILGLRLLGILDIN
jgi:hypothetical protein